MGDKRESWGSRFGFIMTAAGFSIGLGNIWRFPYLVGVNGGGAFLITYLLIIVFISLPLFIAEVSLGRKTQLNPIAGMRKLTKKGSPWVLIGWFGILASFFIMTYYMSILGWVFVYFFKVLFGLIDTTSPETIALAFQAFTSSPLQVAFFAALAMVIVGLISSKGLKDGLEKSCKVMMPALFIILIILAIRSLTLPGAMEGLKWYLTPDFSKITFDTALAALGQTFFSIGIASAAAFIYGSYLDKKDSNLPTDLTIVAVFDTFGAFTAGLVIFPAIFALGLQPDVGTSLLFVTLPNLFAQLPLGNIFGGAFFFLVSLAGVSSALGYLEAVVLPVAELRNMDRRKTVWATLAVMFIIGLAPVMSLGPWKNILIFGRTFFDFADYLSANILMAVGGLLIALYTGYVWRFENFQADTNVGAQGLFIPKFFKPLYLFVIPVAIGILLVKGLGLF